MATTKLLTIEDVEALPNEGWRYDVIRGVLHRMAPAGFEHGELAYDVGFALGAYAHPRGLGRVVASETGFVVSRDPLTVLAPDIAFVRAGRLPPRRERRGFLEVVPDLVVEVVSPPQSRSDIEDKAAEYLAAGVPLVWLLYARRRVVAVHRPERPVRELGLNDVLDGEEVLPGFRLPVASLFRELP